MPKMIKLLATCFKIGYLPVMPGTWASLAGVGVYCFLHEYPVTFFAIAVFLLIAGIWISGKAEKEIGLRDPKEIVIDEFASQMLVFAFIPFSITNVVVGFLLFRVLDVFKLPPIKKIEELPGGFGIMIDDAACAVIVNMVLQVINRCVL